MNEQKPTPITGIRYYLPSEGWVLEGRDGKVCVPLGGVPIPLEENDFSQLDQSEPTYDAVGRGIYTALRSNPDCTHNRTYACLLKDAYPHLLSELATHIVMLDKKDVEVPYLDRKINYLKIMALIDPEDPRLPLEIGISYLDKGMRLSALQLATVSLYRAHKFLVEAVERAPHDLKALYNLAEVSYVLGKYEEAVRVWKTLIRLGIEAEQVERLESRLKKVEQGRVPHFPAVDYLEVVAVAFGHFQQEEHHEAAALLLDVLDDEVFRQEFQIAEIWYILGLCYQNMAMPKYAEEYLQEALVINPDYPEARSALENLYT